MTDIYWCPVFNKHFYNYWKNIAFFEPEPLIKDLVKIKGKDSAYIQCPAFLDYVKNTYIIRSPFDLTLTVEKNARDEKYIGIDRYDKNFHNDNIFPRFDDSTQTTLLTILVCYLFFTNKSTMVETTPAFMHSTDLIKNTVLIPGTFDISKWYRNIDFSVEIIDETKPLVFKRGDPLFYVKFKTDDKINLIRTEYNDELFNVVESCTTLKNIVRSNTLDENYNSAKGFLTLFKDKFFKKKCPFKFFKR
jgi:hypothetical protein